MARRPLLQALIEADARNLPAQGALASSHFKTGDTATGEALLAGAQQRADAGDADAQVFANSWRGVPLLNGWGVEKEGAAAIASLQLAARTGRLKRCGWRENSRGEADTEVCIHAGDFSDEAHPAQTQCLSCLAAVPPLLSQHKKARLRGLFYFYQRTKRLKSSFCDSSPRACST